MHDRHLSFLVETLEARHAGVESVLIVDLAQLGRTYANLWPEPVVRVVRERNQRVETVIGAGQFQHNQNTFRLVPFSMSCRQWQTRDDAGHGL